MILIFFRNKSVTIGLICSNSTPSSQLKSRQFKNAKMLKMGKLDLRVDLWLLHSSHSNGAHVVWTPCRSLYMSTTPSAQTSLSSDFFYLILKEHVIDSSYNRRSRVLAPSLGIQANVCVIIYDQWLREL